MEIAKVYRRIQHDFANQLQLLEAYKQLGMTDKVNLQIDRMLFNIRLEQQFLKLNVPILIGHYLNIKLNDRLFDWTFDIDIQTSAIDLLDQTMTNDFLNVVNQYKNCVVDKSEIELCLYENETAIEMRMVLTGEDIKKNLKMDISDEGDDFISIHYHYLKEVF
ncbi:Spo0B domain-containing protein [Macrococcus sp. DPC7161]|uniref:Spo0B domain-containing protein n=1 Tax=Macrococcus sp. DPC7161 TaxID=2507060 RepID=UPI00100AAA17|nr:Spo0B domain-containing protein [Macrococcus sp. DPC7161]RXK18147.1 hypothetical protein ER639_05510 [Macrococcus sp. DPC7161]